MSRSAHHHAVRFYAAVALGVAATSAAILLRTSPRDFRPGLALAIDTAVGDWCGDGLEAIAGGGCFAPSGRAAPATLLVYLHGRYAPEGASAELERQSRVARLATARGYAVLALRGRQGQCTAPELRSSWCWPSNERNASDGPAFVARWSVALREAERRAPPPRRVLLGFSNGGYFAALIASRALAPFDAVSIAHAGPVTPMTPAGPRPPILLVDADDDPSGPEVSRLDAELTRASWPHAVVVRGGGHALTEWDIDMSLTFFDRVQHSGPPLVPPLPARTMRSPAQPEIAPALASASASEPAPASEPASASEPPPASATPVLDPPP